MTTTGDVPAPDLHELIEHHGGYDKIPPEAWTEYDRALADWQERRRFHLGRSDPKALCICGLAAVYMRSREGGGRPIWRCQEHRNRWPDYTLPEDVNEGNE